ncbi:hypothetical protein JW968_01135 [Candidatus Woesearchaeota archaeon]|nr:hypothetical protein [Candidatus Woesearchaeota archaeon]
MDKVPDRASLENRARLLSEGLKCRSFAALFVSSYMLNEIVQEIKHGYYHLRDIEHMEVEDEESSFQYYLRIY